jgi:hypothetical protein
MPMSRSGEPKSARVIHELMTPAEALAFVKTQGVVLEAGTGPVASLAEAVAGGPIHGSWWAHPQGRQIFAVTRAVRIANRFPVADLAQIREAHTPSGKHVTQETPFPDWVPDALAAQAPRRQAKMSSSVPSILFDARITSAPASASRFDWLKFVNGSSRS